MATTNLLQNHFPVLFLCFSFKIPRFPTIGFVFLTDVEKLADVRMIVLSGHFAKSVATVLRAILLFWY
jgi:hypothetical protein